MAFTLSELNFTPIAMESLAKELQLFADKVSIAGDLQGSSIVLAARQALRVLYETRRKDEKNMLAEVKKAEAAQQAAAHKAALNAEPHAVDTDMTGLNCDPVDTGDSGDGIPEHPPAPPMLIRPDLV